MVPLIKQMIPAPSVKVITEKEIIIELKGMAENRLRAFSAYPSAKSFGESNAAALFVLQQLQYADCQLNPKTSVKICLRLENHLLYLAPRTTIKIFNTYKDKLDFCMNACRTILNYKRQGL